MMKNVFLCLLMLVGPVSFLACKKSFTGYTEETSVVGFQQSGVIISDDAVAPTPVVISLSKINFYNAFTIYVSVDDTNGYLKDNLLSLSNGVFKAADYTNGDSQFIYKVVVAKGTKQAALMVMPQVNDLERIPHSLTFKIVPDPSKALQRQGAEFYNVDNHNNQVTITVKPN